VLFVLFLVARQLANFAVGLSLVASKDNPLRAGRSAFSGRPAVIVINSIAAFYARDRRRPAGRRRLVCIARRVLVDRSATCCWC